MWILVLSIIVLGIVVAFCDKFFHRNSAGDDVVQSASSCSTCNGESGKCEQECMMEAAVKPVEYYDDEELDAFKGRRSAEYTDDEAEQFSYVLYTMRPEEVAGWCRSLNLRGIELPDQVKDEVVMIVSDGHS